MTCREKLAIEHPERLVPEYTSGCWGCPSDFGYLPDPEYCNGRIDDKCCACWDRDILKEPGFEEPTIKDSGDRTQFSTGAVRDMHAGKGRFDVAPMEVVANILHSPVLSMVADFQRTGKTDRLYAAIEQFTIECYSENSDEETLNKLSSTMLLEVAKHYEEGAIKYEPDNWRKGIPVWCYIDSATRHYVKWRRGDTNERHDRAFIWNLMCCIWEVDYGEEWRKNKEESQ